MIKNTGKYGIINLLITTGILLLSAIPAYALNDEEVKNLYNFVLAQKQARHMKDNTSKPETQPESKSYSDLDRLYKPLVEPKKLLYEFNTEYFKNQNYSNHGGTNLDKHNFNSSLNSIGSNFTFSPLAWLEITAGFKEIMPKKMKQSFYARQTEDLSLIYRFKTEYFQDYNFKARARTETIELWLDVAEKRSRIKRTDETIPDPPNQVTRINSNYEDINLGLRFISKNETDEDLSNLSKLKRPLMKNNQLNLEGSIGYRHGKLDRKTNYTNDLTETRFNHNLKWHLLPRFGLKYGLTDDFEIDSGLVCATPIQYKYEEIIQYTNGTTNSVAATYKLTDNVSLPLKFNFRPIENFEASFSSDYTYASQILEYSQKNTVNTTTNYGAKKLNYYNFKPTINLVYLFDADKQIQDDGFSLLTKRLIIKNQLLVDLEYERDVTHLSRNGTNIAQNIIDPYNGFLYPQNAIFSYTEFAGASPDITLNSAFFGPGVRPQNYSLLKGKIVYGLTDYLNFGFTLGYHSSSANQQFVFPYLSNYSFKIKPYYFIDFMTDWRITKNSLLSLTSHFVPGYRTNYDNHTDLHDFKFESNYLDILLNLEILF